MEVGKKYRGGSFVYVCSAITPGGGAIVHREDQTIEYLVRKNDQFQYKEVKEKQKVYVFLVKINGIYTPHSYIRRIDAESCVELFSKISYRLASDITEVEIEVK